MGSSRFVRPATTVLKLSQGDTLTVKNTLSAGEQRARFAFMSLAGVDGTLTVNRLHVGLATILAYLVDWTLTDDDGRLVPIRGVSADELTAVLDALDVESFTEIREAIEEHEAARTAEREEKKRTAAGGTPSDLISPLPSAPAPASASTKLETLM
jgi:hypothetical protein